MRNYRLVLVIKRTLDKKAVESLFDDIKKSAGEVKNGNEKLLGERKFSYKIGGEQSGSYIVWEFESERIPQDFENKLRINDDVVRHLLVRLD